MKINSNDLRAHYNSLSDEALLALDRSELTDAARECYDNELLERDLSADSDGLTEDDTDDVEAEWLEDAACACSFVAYPGSPAASDAHHARAALQAQGIPCQVSVRTIQPAAQDPEPHDEYWVMVPGPSNLHATSVLDREVFNPQIEADWRSHLEGLSDEELESLTPDMICAGLLDRVKRLESAFHEEIARRRGD